MEIKDYDVFYDLGCGDGRILIEAAKRGAKKCVGVEYDVKLAELSLKNVESSGFSHMIEIKIGNFLTLDISDATLIYVFLLPKPVELLKPRFIELMNNANLKMAASVLYELKD